MRFGLEGGKNVILDRELALSEGPQILKQHAITFDRSAELRWLPLTQPPSPCSSAFSF